MLIDGAVIHLGELVDLTDRSVKDLRFGHRPLQHQTLDNHRLECAQALWSQTSEKLSASRSRLRAFLTSCRRTRSSTKPATDEDTAADL